MSLEQAISTELTKERLGNLWQHVGWLNPTYKHLFDGFGAYLANRLNPTLTSEGFLNAIVFSLHELVEGGRRLRYGTEVEFSPGNRYFLGVGEYNLLWRTIPDIAKATCPPEFAQELKERYETLNKQIMTEGSSQ